jgi:methylisocitrate lyase
MTEFGKSPALDAPMLATLGYRLVLYPVTALRSALGAVRATFGDLLARGQQWGRLDTMLTRAELYDLLDYADYEARDRAFFEQR